MAPLLFALPGNEPAAAALAPLLGAEPGGITARRFPDGESYVRIDTPVADRDVIFVCTLHRPDDKLLPLQFAASAARELGARRIGLIAPYLAYLRQDWRFQPGEAVTCDVFAELISRFFDWLATVDPHLHRRHSLGEVYRIPHQVAHAAPAVADWIREYVPRPVLIGPDEESAQWVSAVAARTAAPYLVLEKVRHGDRDVEVSVPQVDRWRDRTPVLVDDIIATARTMIETVGHIRRAGLAAPVCIGVHAVFAGNAYADLVAAGAGKVVTCNTIPHPSNGIDLHPLLVEAVEAVEDVSGRRSGEVAG